MSESEQIGLLPARDPREIIERAIATEKPRELWPMLSGGKDSTVTIQALIDIFGAAYFTGVLHVSTGIGLASTTEFVREFCADRGLPLHIAQTPEGEYEAMVREHGFPGPGAHRFPYVRLKERALDAFIASRKTHHFDRIGLVTGVRIAESKRRMGTCRDISRDGAQVWIAPLIDWTNADMHEYRTKHNVPMSPASREIHISGECLCGAMADSDASGELSLIATFYREDPAVQTILRLQDELIAAGHPRCRWGVPVAEPDPPYDPGIMPMCFDCTVAS